MNRFDRLSVFYFFVIYIFYIIYVWQLITRVGLGILIQRRDLSLILTTNRELRMCVRAYNQSDLLGDPEITANMYCNFMYLYWEGYVICSIYLR